MVTNLLFSNMPINASLEVGDLVFYSGTVTSYGTGAINQVNTTDSNGSSTTTLLGTIAEISFEPSSIFPDAPDGSFVIIVNGNTTTPPSPGSYIFFAKDNNVNLSSIKGYYNSVTFKNNSTEKAEMFAAACDITESSK